MTPSLNRSIPRHDSFRENDRVPSKWSRMPAMTSILSAPGYRALSGVKWATLGLGLLLLVAESSFGQEGVFEDPLAAALSGFSVVPEASFVFSDAERPPIRFTPADPARYTVPRKARTVDSIVIHITEGYQTIARWAGPPLPWELVVDAKGHDKVTSSHFVVQQNGRITQMVDVANIAWHAGNYNDRSIGIDLMGREAEGPGVFTEEMMDSLVLLVKWLTANHGIARTQPGSAAPAPAGAGILLHNQINPRHSCPGRHFPAAEFYRRLQAPQRVTPIGPGCEEEFRDRDPCIVRDEVVRLSWVRPVMSLLAEHQVTDFELTVRYLDPATFQWIDLLDHVMIGNRTSVAFPDRVLGASDLPQGLLTWKVRAQNAHGLGHRMEARYFHHLRDLPSRPRILAPAPATVAGPLVLAWDPLRDEGVYHYEIQGSIYANDRWSAWIPLAVLQSTRTSIDLTGSLQGGSQYVLAVRGINTLGAGEWSTVQFSLSR